MRRLLVAVAALALASCTPPEPEPEPVVKKPPPKMTPAPPPPPEARPAAPAPPPPPPPIVKPPPAPPEPKVFPVKVELVLDPPPPQDTDPARIYLPAFTIRTMDHAQVEVGLNGDRFSTTSCLWSVSETLVFDPKIPVPDWPPAGAKFVGTTSQQSGKAEVWIAPAEDVRTQAPHLKDGEHVLYVKGQIRGAPLLGALRLYVGKPGLPYRYTNYSPVMDMESEGATRFARTMWFESTKNGE